MSQHIYGASSSSLGGGGGGGWSNSSIPMLGPATALDAIEVADDAPSIPPSFSILASQRQKHLQSWPRQRRRDSKSPHHSHHKSSHAASSTPSHLGLQLPSLDSTVTAHPQQLQPPFSLSPPQSAFLHHRSQDTEKQSEPTRQSHKLPYPLNDDRQGRSPSHSPPGLPSPPPSAPSATDLPEEVEQLAGELSRHHLQRADVRPAIRSIIRSGNGSGRGASGRGSVASSVPTSRNGSRYRDAMANFSTGMAGLRLRSGGNAPVADLEVDMDQDNRNDSGDCQLRQPSPAPLSSAPSFSQSGPPPSSYAVSTEFDVGPSVPLGLLRMRRRQAALADTSVAHLNLGLAPFARQISPEADEASGPRQTTDTVTATATATPDMPPDMTDASTVTTTVTTATTITATATSTPVAASTGATALAAASPIEADDEDLPPRPEDAIAAMVAPFPQHSFNSHSRPLSRSYHSQSLSLSKSTPNSHSHSHHPSVSATGTPAWNIRPVDCLRLSPESLAMPHLAPLHNDVPSSGYDLQGWISSSSTVESTAALTTGTIDACYVPLPADVIEVDNGNGAPATVDTAAEGAMSSNDQSDSRSTVQDGTAALLAAQARLRQQQNKQFYTAYLRPHQLPFYREMTAARNGSHGPNPPVDVLEADSGSPEEPLPVIAAATASTHQSSDKTRTPTGPYMGHSQRIRLIRKAMAREAGRARSQQSIDGSSTAGSIVVADDDMMDVDMVDPAAFNSSSHISAVDAMGGDDMLEPLTSLPEFGEAGDFYKYMGPFRYRLSSEVAMRCTNLVRNKPRMRRRRQPGEGSATNDGGSSARGSSAKGGSSLHSERCRERHAERRAADCADRTDRADRIETSRDLGRDTLQDGRERRSRVNRRHEQTRLADAHTQALAHVNAQAEGLASHLPSLVGAKVEAEAEAKADSSRPVPGPATTSSLPQHRLRMEQFPLPAWRLPAPVPIEAINVDTP